MRLRSLRLACWHLSLQGCGRVAGGASRSRSAPAAPTALRCSVLRVRRRTRYESCALFAQTPDAESEVEARCARDPQALRCSPAPRRPAGHPPAALQKTAELYVEKNSFDPVGGRSSSNPYPKFGVSAKRRAGMAGRGASEPASSAGLAGRARSALRNLTRRPVSERSGQSPRSEFGDGPARPSSAAQSAPQATTGSVKPRRPPARSLASSNARKPTPARSQCS